MNLDNITPEELAGIIDQLIEDGTLSTTGHPLDKGQLAFSRYIGVNVSTVKRWLNGQTKLTGYRARCVRELTGVKK